MEESTKGAWIVHHANKIEVAGEPSGLDSLRKAGNCGVLLSSLCGTQQSSLEMKKVKTLAEVAGIDLTYQLPALLAALKQQALIEFNDDGVEVLGLTTRGVLENTTKIFDGLAPHSVEKASIEVAELCSAAPRTAKELREYVGDQHSLSLAESNRLLNTIEKIDFCDTEEIDSSTKVYFNGSLFKGQALKKTQAVLSSISITDQGKVRALDDRLKAEGCVEKSQAMAMLGESLFRKLHSIGMYDVNTVSNSRETVEYLTKPSAFNKFGRSDISDAFDLAKAFVASLEYGMTRSVSGRGQIVFLKRLMEKLIGGATIGPCTAIGQDYRLLELRGVVRVTPAGRGMFNMKLLKRDVGELALQVLMTGDASEQSLDVLPGSPLGKYVGPERNRVKARKEAGELTIDVRAALDTLRTQGI